MDSTAITALLLEPNTLHATQICEGLGELPQGTLHVQVLHASSLAEGIDRCGEHVVDVIFTNLTLPDSTGLETILRLTSSTSGIPIIVVTEADNEALALEAVREGAQDYLVKGTIDTEGWLRIMRYAIERKRAEGELAHLASFPEQNPVPIMEVNDGGAITYLNPSARRTFPDLLQQGVKHPMLHDMSAVWSTLQRRPHEAFLREIPYGPRIFEESISTTPTRNLLRMYASDITERKRLEQLKDEFISTVSHELRTPLTIIKGAISNLEDGIVGTLSAPQLQIVKMANRNIARLTRIINDLLDLSRLESGKAKIARGQLALPALITDTLQDFRAEATARGITLTCDSTPQLPEVFADRDLIAQVLTNVLNNALRFAVKKIAIRARPARTGVQLSIIDDGPGIDVDEQGKLFNKFEQLHRAQGGAGYKGTGLGLAICKEIMHHHEGKIWVESSPSHGATFHLLLPAYDVAADCRATLGNAIHSVAEQNTALTLIAVTFTNSARMRHALGEIGHHNMLAAVQEKLGRTLLRKGDHCFLIAPDQLLIVLPNMGTDGIDAMQHRLRSAIDQVCAAHKELPIAPQLRLRTALYPKDALDADHLMEYVLQRDTSTDHT